MMEAESSMLSFVEIHVPLEFIREALILAGNDEKCVLERKGIFPALKEQVNLSFVKLKTHLKMTFEKLHFISIDGVHQCILNGSEDEIHNKNTNVQAQDDSKTLENQNLLHSHTDELFISCLQEDVHSPKLGTHQSVTENVKRKRGRPRKIKPTKSCVRSAELDTSDVNKETSDSKEISNCSAMNASVESNECQNDSKQNVAEKKTHSQCSPERTMPCTDRKRYCLRGKKLNSQIMAFVKGLDENFGNNDSEIEDETFLMPDSNSDEEVKSSKRNKKMLQKNDTDAKENKNCVKEIKNKVEEILRSGNKLCVNKPSEGNLIIMTNCKICEKKLCNNLALHEHVLQMHEHSESVDEYLQEILKSGDNSKLKENTCCFCDETFIDSVSLRNHQTTVHKDTAFSCPLCGHKSKNLAYLKIHIRNMHVQVGKRAFCHLCTASFRSHGSLRQHIDLNHYGNKYVSCDICKKQFYNKSQLRRHMRAHGLGGFRRFSCEICGKNFSFEYNLKRHNANVHQPQSECFHCSYCGKGFSQKVPMISHVQLVHFNLFPYSCKECGDSFLKAALLKEHMHSVHHRVDFEIPVMPKNSVYNKTAEDKLYCSYCNESFTHKIRLIEHMHGDHADAFPFKCETCVQGFIERSFLVLHMLKAHGVLIQNEEDVPKRSDSAGEIMQIITTRNGYPNKIVQPISGEEMLTDNNTKPQEAPECVVKEAVTKDTSEYMEDVPQVSSSSLLVEVAQGSNTYQYVIEAPESLNQSGSELAVQDIANLLIAAEKTVQEGQQEEFETEPSSVQEINLVIDDSVQHGQSDSHIALTGNNAQTVEVLLGQNDQNTSLLTTDNQGQPMEVVIDQTEQNSAVFTIENQAQTLQIEHGDIIELNDSNSDGRNYYRIINVLDNQ